MDTDSGLFTRVALGAAGGFVGTVALQALMTASQKWLPGTVPPLRRDPGEFMVEKTEAALPDAVRQRIPRAAEKAAAQGLAAGYGLAFGALYAALRPRGGSPLVEGIVLGLGCWAAGYLGWLPALGLMPPLHRQRPAQVAGPVAEHVAYGVTTVAAYDWLRERV